MRHGSLLFPRVCEGRRLSLLTVAVVLASSNCGLPDGSRPLDEPTRAAAPASAESPPPAERVFQADFAAVWKAVLEALADRDESINTRDEKEGRVLTDKATVNRERLEKIAETGGRRFEDGGWYVLTLRITRRAERETKVAVEPFIVGSDPERDNVWGGVPLKSRTTLEAEVFDAIGRRLTTR